MMTAQATHQQRLGVADRASKQHRNDCRQRTFKAERMALKDPCSKSFSPQQWWCVPSVGECLAALNSRR